MVSSCLPVPFLIYVPLFLLSVILKSISSHPFHDLTPWTHLSSPTVSHPTSLNVKFFHTHHDYCFKPHTVFLTHLFNYSVYSRNSFSSSSWTLQSHEFWLSEHVYNLNLFYYCYCKESLLPILNPKSSHIVISLSPLCEYCIPKDNFPLSLTIFSPLLLYGIGIPGHNNVFYLWKTSQGLLRHKSPVSV